MVLLWHCHPQGCDWTMGIIAVTIAMTIYGNDSPLNCLCDPYTARTVPLEALAICVPERKPIYMTLYPTLTCASRTGTGKNAARKLRHQGLLPATVYGHGSAVSLVLPQQHFKIIEQASKSGSQLVSLSIDGQDSGLAMVKMVQRDALKHTPVHLDLQRVSLLQEMLVTVTVVLTGEPAGVKEGGMLETHMHALHLRCAANALPDNVTHDISAMKIGDTLDAAAIALPDGCTLMDRPEECVALIRQPIRTAAKSVAE